MQLLPRFHQVCCEALTSFYEVPSANAGALEAVVLYSVTELWSLPTVATLAGIYKAVPLLSAPADSTLSRSELGAALGDLPVRFDAGGAWQDAEEATEWALSNLHRLCNSTASLVVVQVNKLIPQACSSCLRLFWHVSGVPDWICAVSRTCSSAFALKKL